MSLQNISPKKTIAWKNLEKHFNKAKVFNIKKFYLKNKNRKKDFSIELEGLKFDYSKNLISKKTIDLLIKLAKEVNLKNAISKYFSGDKINATENRAVLHTALRNSSNNKVFVDGKDIKFEIHSNLKNLQFFSNKIISGKWKGYSGKAITDIVNIGIGGSYLGPSMVVNALKFYKNHLNIHFINNIDGDHVLETLKNLNSETTLFIVVSKTFSTQETLYNALTIKKWFLKKASIVDIPKHFISVTSNFEKAKKFGVDEKNIFPMWDWVGGRFSLWSSVGISICLSVGYNNFIKLLNGAQYIDNHFKTADFNKNIPILMALISIWYNNFFKTESELILPYCEYLSKFPEYLQQSSMESNGKNVDRNGKNIDYQTGNIIWGSTGTNAQHAFMQLIHQGTKMIPIDFIGFTKSLYNIEDHHKQLMANYYAQIDALAFGKTKEDVHLQLKINSYNEKINFLLPHKLFEGNKPSNSIILDKLTPSSLGKLISLYEHKIFTQGIIWNIFSYDQFGVELGKELAKKNLSNNFI